MTSAVIGTLMGMYILILIVYIIFPTMDESLNRAILRQNRRTGPGIVV